MKMTSETFKAAFGRNPVPKPTQDALKPGMYRATLESIDMVQVDVWENGVKTGAQEEKFDFTFRLENGTILHKKVRPKMSVKSDCLKLVSSMLSTGVPADIIKSGDNDAYLDLMLSLVGKRFVVKKLRSARMESGLISIRYRRF